MSLQDLPKSGSNTVGLGNTTAQASVLCLDFFKKVKTFRSVLSRANAACVSRRKEPGAGLPS